MRIIFCGVGALGSNCVQLCRNLEATLVLVDFDRVESKNLLAQAFVRQSIGKNKAEALKLQLANFHGIKAESFGVRVSAENVEALCSSSDLMVDCFDNLAGRQVLAEFARTHGKPLVHAAISKEGTFGLVRWDERFVADPEDQVGQATCEGGEHLPLIGAVSAALARCIQDFIEAGTRRDVMISLNAVTPTAG